MGGERIEVVAHDPAELPRAAQLLAPDGTATTEEHTRRITIRLPGDHPFLLSLLWTTALLVVFAPLAVWRYRSIDR